MQKIRIDFDNPGLPQHISAVENDSQSRFFQAVLYENGKAYTAPAGASYSIMYRGFGPQNQGWYDTINDGAGKRAACKASGNVVTCEIARQALQVPGHVSIVLCVTTGKGYMLKSWPIECDCKNDRYDSTAEIESFFYITQVSNADWTQAIQAAEELKNTIDPTLSLSGKAADAKAAGDALKEETERAKEAENQIKEEIDPLFVKSRNLLNLTAITPNTWISNESGNINKYDGYSSTDYIPIGGLSTLFFVCISNGIYKDVGNNFGAYYDAEKHYISGFAGVQLGIAISPNAKYVRVSNKSKNFDENVKPIISSIDIWNPKPTTVEEYEIYGEQHFDDSENTLPNVYKKINELETNSYTIPSYYIEHLQKKELQIRNNYEKCGEHGDSFVFITDYHDTSNSGNSANLIYHIMDNSPVGFVCLNGDLINDKTTKDLGRQSMINVIQKFCYLPTDKFFVTVGNHEFNNAGNNESYRDRQLSISEVYSIINKKSETFIRDVDGYDYYVDNKAQKIRYYFIGSTIGSNPYSGATKWIAESLTGIKNGYSAIIFSHIGLNSSANDWESSFDKIVAILEAYKNHTAYMLDGKNYDFSSKEGDVIGIFSGHMHLDGAITTTAGIPFIATTCDAYREEFGKLIRENGTITEQAFDVVQIDRINRKIYMTRIGAGNDRDFSY